MSMSCPAHAHAPNCMNYQSKEWQDLRIKILRRDEWTCQTCGQLCLGKKKNGHSPVVDHIEPVKQRPDLAWNPTNLRVLCRSCDNKRHSEKGRGYEIPMTGPDGFPIGTEWQEDG